MGHPVGVGDPNGEPAARAALVLLAAGDGRRTGADTNKVLLPLAGRPVFAWAIRSAHQLPAVVDTTVVIRTADAAIVERALGREVERTGVRVVIGGRTRHGSEWAALQALAPAIEADEIDVVVIHDAARPLASTALFGAVIDAAHRRGGAIPALTQTGLVAVDPGTDVTASRVVAVQTPQAFAARPLLEAYRQADREGFVGTDTASCIERYADLQIHCVDGDARNVKITYPEDVLLAERLLTRAEMGSDPGPPRSSGESGA